MGMHSTCSWNTVSLSADWLGLKIAQHKLDMVEVSDSRVLRMQVRAIRVQHSPPADLSGLELDETDYLWLNCVSMLPSSLNSATPMARA
jgi:hypothetical protein